MFIRHVTIELQPDAVTEFARIMEGEVTPLLKKEDGFLDQVTMVTQDCAEAVVITFWKSEESEEAFNRAGSPEVTRRLLAVVAGHPKVSRFEAISSTFYRRAA